jgi:hypothetical protein
MERRYQVRQRGEYKVIVSSMIESATATKGMEEMLVLLSSSLPMFINSISL